MNLEEKINEDLKSAIKEKKQAKIRGLRAIKAAILLFKTDGSGRELTSELGLQLLQKLVKQRKESLDIYKNQNRQDLAVIEAEEIEVIQAYLPKPLTEDELKTKLTEIISEVGAKTMKDMGSVMALVAKRLPGQDGKRIAGLVRSLLSG